jgi:hypothetical protein
LFQIGTKVAEAECRFAMIRLTAVAHRDFFILERKKSYFANSDLGKSAVTPTACKVRDLEYTSL